MRRAAIAEAKDANCQKAWTQHTSRIFRALGCERDGMIGSMLRIRMLCSVRWALVIVAIVSSGCSSFKCQSIWIEGGLPCPNLSTKAYSIVPSISGADRAEGRIDWLQMACRRHEQGEWESLHQNSVCVDDFYSASLWSWQAFSEQDDAPEPFDPTDRTVQQYNQSLSRLLHEGEKHHRLRPGTSLQVQVAGKPCSVPVELRGFAWTNDDFQHCIVVGHYVHRTLSHVKKTPGIGVPVVITRTRAPNLPHESDFLPSTAVFSATAVLHPDGTGLALYNPQNTTTVEIDGRCLPLARDLTASLAYGLHHHSQTRVRDFLRPDGAQASSKLYFLEPYQPDKIPVVFVHGLLSSPDAWADLYNELRADPVLSQSYQFWAFKYSTGAPFIRSAATLRNQMDAAYERFDPVRGNPNLRRGVLIGHSMGGLISKLMIAHSGEDVWDSVANLPLESVATSEETRAGLANRFYFDPHPMASRVVFIATPHQGSQTAGRAIGKVASKLVVQNDNTFDQLIEDNIGGFKETVTRGLPTSIDLLNPKQPFLGVLDRLALSDCVPLHTILGTGLPISLHRSDGVVSIASAQHPKAVSEVKVPSTHNGVLRRPETIHEIKRILQLHLLGPDASYGPGAYVSTSADASDGGSPSLSIGSDEALPVEASPPQGMILENPQPLQIGPESRTP
jgi:pimeloyl-ACP methyl ester carboxylesterase